VISSAKEYDLKVEVIMTKLSKKQIKILNKNEISGKL